MGSPDYLTLSPPILHGDDAVDPWRRNSSDCIDNRPVPGLVPSISSTGLLNCTDKEQSSSCLSLTLPDSGFFSRCSANQASTRSTKSIQKVSWSTTASGTLTPMAAMGSTTIGSGLGSMVLRRTLQVENINISELRKDKCFQKQMKKHQKDVEDMKKRHQKQRDAIQKQQQTSVDKLLIDNNKMANKKKGNIGCSSNPSSTANSATNTTALGSRHSSLSGRASDPVMTNIENQHCVNTSTANSDISMNIGDKRIRDLVINQTDEWSRLNRAQELEEFEMRKKQIREEFDLLRKLLLEAQKQQMCALKLRFEAENKELKQSQTKKSMDDSKIVQQDKGIKTKAERDRRVKELNEKNVKMFVEERKRLATKCRRHEEQLEKRHAEQSEALDRETARALEQEEMNHREALLASRPESVV